MYIIIVSTQSSSETYVGLATNFKERYRKRTASFRHQSKRNETELSKHIWALKDNNKPFNIKWRITVLSSVDLIATLATNVTYAFLRSL